MNSDDKKKTIFRVISTQRAKYGHENVITYVSSRKLRNPYEHSVRHKIPENLKSEMNRATTRNDEAFLRPFKEVALV